MLFDLPSELQQMIIASLAKYELLALRATCRHSNNLCGQYIMKRIVDEMRDDSTITSYLHKASENCWHDFLLRLLDFQPPVDNMDAVGETAMHKAVRSNCLFCVRHLLCAGADPQLATTHGWSPLMLAARYGYVAVAQELLQAGADANARGFHGWTALHLAYAFGYTEIARALKNFGVKTNTVDNDGVKAREASCGYKCWGVVAINYHLLDNK